ncbi:MAG TPA: hypothetical protein VMU21_00235 [Thermodesulfovibrionales bacterium]|nr:hypothetical protein [Thermodesulfovibrionales bacterium]
MKRVWLLIAMLLLAGCGSGGGSNVSNSQPGGSQPGGIIEVGPSTPTGNVVVNIVEGDAKTSAAIPPDDHVRLVVTNPNLRINGSVYKLIVDGLNPGGHITGLKFPVATGYTFELITYAPDHVQPLGTVPINRMVQHAKTPVPVNITPDGATVDLTINTITACINDIPTPAYSNAPLGITATFTLQPTPLQPGWNLFLNTSLPLMSHALHSTATPIANHALVKAPIVLTEQTLYAQAEFYINQSLLDTTGLLDILNPITMASPPTLAAPHAAENIHDWTFNCPNPDAGDDPSAHSVFLQLVGVSIPTP